MRRRQWWMQPWLPLLCVVEASKVLTKRFGGNSLLQKVGENEQGQFKSLEQSLKDSWHQVSQEVSQCKDKSTAKRNWESESGEAAK